MRTLNKIVRVVALVMLVSVGLALVVLSISRTNWNVLEEVVTRGRWFALSVGLAVFCFGIIFGLSGVRAGPRERFLSFDGENGTVSISTIAIADYLAKLGTEFPSVLRLRPRVMPARRSVDIVLELRVREGPQIHELCDLLQKRVRESLTNGLGINEVRRVEVRVHEIVSEHRSR